MLGLSSIIQGKKLKLFLPDVLVGADAAAGASKETVARKRQTMRLKRKKKRKKKKEEEEEEDEKQEERREKEIKQERTCNGQIEVIPATFFLF